MSRPTILVNILGCGALRGRRAARFLSAGKTRERCVLPGVALALAWFFAGGALVSPMLAESAGQAGTHSAAPAPVRYHPNRFSKRATAYYGLVWGVDSLQVKWAESGEIVRLSYRVLDVNKAKPLHDKQVEPYLIDPQARVKLVVPSLEKVGQLRSRRPPEANKSYWMAFSNKGRLVKRGDRVDVVIGHFRADGLVVE